MEALTEEKAEVHVNGLPVEVTEDEGCARAALTDVEEQTILGTTVEVCETTTRAEGSPIRHALPGETSDSGAARNGKKIFVGGLPPDLSTEEFTSFFERFGEITDAVIIPNAMTRRSRGFGFVTFDSNESVNSVLQSNRYIIKDKNVEVKLAIPKEEINAENRPYNTSLPYEIRPSIYGYRHHYFNAFTLMPGMSGFLAASQLHANNRTELIRITRPPVTNIEARTSSTRDSRPSPSHSGINNLPDRGSSSVDRQSGGC